MTGRTPATRHGLCALLLALGLLPGVCLATSFITFDPRAVSLGSSGVASSHPYNAPVFNPALVTLGENSGKGAFGRFAIGVRVNDRDDFLGGLDQYKANDNERGFRDALRNFNASVRALDVTVDDYAAVLDSTESLLVDIERLSDRPLRAGVGVNVTMGLSREETGVAFFVRQTSIGGSIVRISNQDIENIHEVLDVLRTVEDAVRTGDVPADFRLPEPAEDFTSDVAVEAGQILEYGAALGWQPNNGSWRFGINLKRIGFTSYDYALPIAEARGTSFRWREHQRIDNFTNVDVGTSWERNGWRVGLVARNLRKRDIVTVRDNIIELRPQVRMGVAYESRRYFLTADLDLTRNEPLGFDPETRFLSIGGEFRLHEYAAVRTGVRHNLVSGENSPSLGFGLGPARAHVDFAVTSWKGQHAFAMQFGTHF